MCSGATGRLSSGCIREDYAAAVTENQGRKGLILKEVGYAGEKGSMGWPLVMLRNEDPGKRNLSSLRVDRLENVPWNRVAVYDAHPVKTDEGEETTGCRILEETSK